MISLRLYAHGRTGVQKIHLLEDAFLFFFPPWSPLFGFHSFIYQNVINSQLQVGTVQNAGDGEMKDTASQDQLVEGSQACNQIMAILCSEWGEHRTCWLPRAAESVPK